MTAVNGQNGSIVAEITKLGNVWHGCGTVYDDVLHELERVSRKTRLGNTMETGCGRTSLVLSNLSERHLVFTVPAPSWEKDDSYQRVITSPFFNAKSTSFVLGPSQQTLLTHKFEEPFDLVLLDGPHDYPFPDLEYFFVYPHVKPGGYLVVDDIWIPTVYNLFAFLKEDAMFKLENVVGNTAFFTRTNAPLHSQTGCDWEGQAYNKARFPVEHTAPPRGVQLRRAVGKFSRPLKSALRRIVRS